MKDIKRSWTESRALSFMWDYEGDSAVPAMLYFIFLALGSATGAGIYTGHSTHNGWLVVLSVVATLAIIWGYPCLRLLSPLNAMNNDRLHPDGNLHNSACGYSRCGRCEGSKDLIREVRALPSSDRAQFPHELIEVLSRDLDPERRYEVNTEIRTTLDEIRCRDEQRALANKRAIPTDHIVGSLKEARESFKIETDTLKELL